MASTRSRSGPRAALSHGAARAPGSADAIDRWALLVGISDYADPSLTLQYAARDAQRLRDVLLQPTAGSFRADHVLVLTDADATFGRLNKALRTFLKRPAPDDLVLLFFACHGAHDPERPGTLYLLPHDADPADISGTALPMRDIDTALRETLVSQRVVVLMDSCHSGGVARTLGGLRSLEAAAADFNRYMGELSDTRGGVSLLTSAMANESSVEGEQWGQGHGVFTHFLLEGLKGKADREPRDGVITVGELFDYVADQVKQATGDRQHPHMSGSSDRDQVLAVMGASTAEQHVELARGLAAAAEWADEPICWLGVAAQYQRALRLRPYADDAALPAATALALARGGDLGAAQGLLQALPRDAGGVRALLGLSELAQGRIDDARATLLAPTAAAPWVQRVLSSSASRGRRVALMVAMDQVNPAVYGGWRGDLRTPEAEARAFGAELQTGFDFDELVWLLGSRATLDALRQTLRELVARSSQFDALVVMLSGHGGEVPDVSGEAPSASGLEGTFCAYDGQILAGEMDALLRGTQAARTTLVVSAAHSGHFVTRAQRSGYEALGACAANQTDFEASRYSTFIEALLPEMRPERRGAEVAQAVRRFVGARQPGQKPQFNLAPELALFVGAGQAAGAQPAELARLLLGAGTAAASDDALCTALALVAGPDMPTQFAGPLLAQAWRRPSLEGRPSLPVPPGDAPLAQRCASLGTAALAATAEPCGTVLEQLAAHPLVRQQPSLLAAVQALGQDSGKLGGLAARLRVLLVGVGSEADGTDPVDNVQAVRQALLAAGVAADRMAVLICGQATTRAVHAAVQRLAALGRQHPTLVYWAGSGTLAALPCHDGAGPDHRALATDLGGTLTLLADGIDDQAPPQQVLREMQPRLTVLLARSGSRGEPGGPRAEPRRDGRNGSARHAPMARAFVQLLQAERRGLACLRCADLEAAGPVRMARGHGGLARLLADPLAEQVHSLCERLCVAELSDVAGRLDAWLDQRGGDDGEVQLQLGVLCHLLSQFDRAQLALEKAVALLAGRPRERARAHLTLARVLLDSGRDRARAVSECRIACETDPTLDAALFWLGRSITELIRSETTTQGSEALLSYLSRGATSGRRAEAQHLLKQLGGSASR